MFRHGQAMLETVIAVLIITSLFLALFKLSHLLTGKILVEHAAMRVARARAVGLNDYICRKSARLCVVPVAGKRLAPVDGTAGEEFSDAMELSRVHLYMNTPNDAVADALLDYEGWHHLTVEPGDGEEARVKLKTDWFTVSGRAALESEFNLYMNNEGR